MSYFKYKDKRYIGLFAVSMNYAIKILNNTGNPQYCVKKLM